MPVSLPPALDQSLDLLRCPTCRTRRLHPGHGALRCPVGHTFDIARHGSRTPPRFTPRDDRTVRAQLSFAMPALRTWAHDHSSLREISRDDVLAVLPASGSPRSTMLQGLRSIFRILKARKLTFINPTARISVPAPRCSAASIPATRAAPWPRAPARCPRTRRHARPGRA